MSLPSRLQSGRQRGPSVQRRGSPSLQADTNQAFGVDLALRSAFEASTVARLARLVDDAVLEQIAALPDDEVARLAGNTP